MFKDLSIFIDFLDVQKSCIMFMGVMYAVLGGYLLFRGIICCSGGLYGCSGRLYVEENNDVFSGH